MDCSLPGSSVPGILQARILNWVAVPLSRGSSPPRDQTCVSSDSCIGKRVLYHSSTWEAPWLLNHWGNLEPKSFLKDLRLSTPPRRIQSPERKESPRIAGPWSRACTWAPGLPVQCSATTPLSPRAPTHPSPCVFVPRGFKSPSRRPCSKARHSPSPWHTEGFES